MGSCGTITGVGRYLKQKNPNIKVIGIDVATSKLSSPSCPKKYKSEGIGVDVITDTLDFSVIDEIIPIEDDAVFAMTKKLAAQGYLVGLSSGAVAHIALNYAEKMSAADLGVLIFADSGRSYLTKVFQ